MPSQDTGDGSEHGRNPLRRQREATRKLQRWIIFRIALFLTGVATILSFLFVGPRGDYTVTVLSLLATFVFGYLGLVTSPSPPPFRRDVPHRPREPSTFAAYLANVLVFSVLGLLVGTGVFHAVLGTIAVQPAQSFTIENERSLGPDRPARVIFDGRTPNRNYLGITLSVDDYIGSGDCATFATATLVPRIGGARPEPVQVESLGTADREASETRIKIGGAVDSLSIDVILHSDLGCRVALRVTGATFYGYIS